MYRIFCNAFTEPFASSLLTSETAMGKTEYTGSGINTWTVTHEHYIHNIHTVSTAMFQVNLK